MNKPAKVMMSPILCRAAALAALSLALCGCQTTSTTKTSTTAANTPERTEPAANDFEGIMQKMDQRLLFPSSGVAAKSSLSPERHKVAKAGLSPADSSREVRPKEVAQTPAPITPAQPKQKESPTVVYAREITDTSTNSASTTPSESSPSGSAPAGSVASSTASNPWLDLAKNARFDYQPAARWGIGLLCIAFLVACRAIRTVLSNLTIMLAGMLLSAMGVLAVKGAKAVKLPELVEKWRTRLAKRFARALPKKRAYKPTKA